MDIFARLEQYKSRPNLEWEGTFADYLRLVMANPKIASLAHGRIYNMVKDGKIDVDDQGVEHFHFFDRDLFGIDESLGQVVEYFKAAAMGSDVGKRILLLYGPPSSGKSQLVILLKRGLEEYTRTNEGAVYGIKGCPQNDNPLVLIPNEVRHDFADETGIHVEGEPCPLCRLNLNDKEKYDGDYMAMPIHRIFFSEKERCGLGTFVPSDPKSQDISELVGSLDLSTIGDFGSESDPRAYRFDGELNIANRGMMEFIEMLKADERFLYVLLTLSQEKNIKTGRFPLIYADECVISHTNETEFNEFLANKKSEALHDRMIMIKIPYNLKVTQEERIYEKLLRQTTVENVHTAPHALKIAATFGVLSRLEEPKKSGLTLIKKLRLYDGKDVEGFRVKDVKSIREDTVREGMDGISPRFVINRLSTSLIKADTICINPIDVLRAIKEGIETKPDINKEQKKKYLALVDTAREEYNEIARNDVQKAFFVSFESEAKALMENYLDNVQAYLDQTKLTDPITGEEVPANEKLLRSIEEKVQIPEHGKDSFRNEIFRKVSISYRRGEPFDYTSHPKLKEAIEKQLFEERRDTIKLTITSRNPDTEQLQKLNIVIETLRTREGYCPDCANELLKYVSSLLSR